MSCLECNDGVEYLSGASLRNWLNAKERLACEECNSCGPILYMCLHKECLFIGCSGNTSDHITLHDNDNPSHSLYLNLSTCKILCTKCQSEITMDSRTTNAVNESDADLEDSSAQFRDSGHCSLNTVTVQKPAKYSAYFNHVPSGRPTYDSTDSSDNEDREPRNRVVGLIGLQNIGNTCYMNAALQALSNTIPLTNFFLECAPTVYLLSEDRKPGLSRQYLTLIKDIWVKKAGGYVVPSGILYGIRNVHAMFRGYHQHDTQEFLRNFMDQLHEELKQACPPECAFADVENMCPIVEEPALSANYDSSEGEYETCDSGVSERSSLSDDTERPPSSAKKRLSRSSSPGRRLRSRLHASSPVVENQPTTSNATIGGGGKKQVKYRSIISDVFDGKLLSSVQCLTCDRISSRVETFQDLSLPIPSRDHLVVLHGRNLQPGITCSDAVLPAQDGWISWILAWLRSWFYGPTVTLHDCLAAFFSTDELKGDNMYSCERCNKLRNGLKYSKVLQLPEVLCIHLKRFRHELMFSSKISSMVNFPLKGLDMHPYLHKECVSQVTTYELFSVICHHGTAGAGHYTCYALNNGQWYEFDDQCVTRVHSDTVQNCEAYVLFYRKTVQDSDQPLAESLAELDAADDAFAEPALLSRQWLARYKWCAEPGPIDDSDFACVHHLISPQRKDILDKLTVTIPKKLYDYLYKKYGGCPAVTTAQVCMLCAAVHRRLHEESEEFRQLNTTFEYQMERPTHLLSSAWFLHWKAFIEGQTSESPGCIDNGGWSPEAAPEDFIEVNRDIWEFFFSRYGGGPELLIPVPEGEGDDEMEEQCEDEKMELSDNLGRGEPLERDMEVEMLEEGLGLGAQQQTEDPLESSMNHSTSSNTSLASEEEKCNGTAGAASRSHSMRHRRKKERQQHQQEQHVQ